MKTAIHPYALRMNDEDNEMMSFLKERLGMGPSQVIRQAIRKLYQAEKRAEKAEAK